LRFAEKSPQGLKPAPPNAAIGPAEAVPLLQSNAIGLVEAGPLLQSNFIGPAVPLLQNDVTGPTEAYSVSMTEACSVSMLLLAVP
jgi:hypothetical protein